MHIEDDEIIREVLKSATTIAVVGASNKPWRDSNSIASFLVDRGYEVFPVNPNHKEILERRCYATLKEIPKPIDIVDVFRTPSAVPAIVDDAIAVKAKTLWLQFGVIHEPAARKAEKHGIRVIMDHCISVDYRRLVR